MNAPHHRDAALAVLGVAAEKDAVAREVSRWAADNLETAVMSGRGCAATMRSIAEWKVHPQGQAVAGEPLLHLSIGDTFSPRDWKMSPFKGVRVLDLTRVLAGPVATRFLAGLGAEVLRIDPPWCDEPVVVLEVALGKRCAPIDLRQASKRELFEHLLKGADVLIHGYRPDALARLGFDAEHRQELSPGLVDVTLDAYGWTGPWKGRRGFDSLVQMSSGIADAGMKETGKNRPTPLPVQALDHSVGYLMAAAAIRGLTNRLKTGAGYQARTSLARMAAMLICQPIAHTRKAIAPETPNDLSENVEKTAWGPARRIKPRRRSAVTMGFAGKQVG